MITIATAAAKDLSIIIAIAKEVWPGTYDPIVAPGQTAFMLQKFYSASALEAQMEQGHIFIIAKENNQPLGFAAFSPEPHHKVKLQKLYVLDIAQGRGVGGMLLHTAIEFAQQTGATQIFLNVNKYNKAQNFYANKGFKIVEEVNISIGNGYFMDDYVMAKAL